MVEYLKDISLTAKQLATGDLTAKIQVRGDTDELGHSLNTMIGEWNGAISNIQVDAIALNE
jgi:methyl-accepting chemotaxis protein